MMDARVVCRELCGDGTYGSVLRGTRYYSPYFEIYPYGVTEMDCAGTESSLSLCNYRTITSDECSSIEGVGINCMDSPTASTFLSIEKKFILVDNLVISLYNCCEQFKEFLHSDVSFRNLCFPF